MTKAVDIITYVGIPLAVAGGLPLLYGFWKSLWIYYQLSKSVPWELRPYFKFIPDFSNGTVTVAAQKIRLSHVGLWKGDHTNCEVDMRQGGKAHYRIHRLLEILHWLIHVFWEGIGNIFHRTIYRTYSLAKWKICGGEIEEIGEKACYFHTVADQDQGRLSSLYESYLVHACLTSSAKPMDKTKGTVVDRPEILFRTWMAFVLDFGFEIHPPYRKFYGGDDFVRFNVNADYSTQTPPLVMNWQHFVWMALGMGVDSLDLVDVEDKTLLVTRNLHFWMTEGEACTWSAKIKTPSSGLNGMPKHFSVCQAFAASYHMLLKHEGHYYEVDLIRPRPRELLEPPTADAPRFRPLDRIDSIRDVHRRMCWWNPFEKLTLRSNMPWYCQDTGSYRYQIRAALRWACYRNDKNNMYNHIKRCKDLKGSRETINVRNKSLYFLFRADNAGTLKAALSKLLKDENEVDLLDSWYAWITQFIKVCDDIQKTIKLHRLLGDISLRVQELASRNGQTLLNTIRTETDENGRVSLRSLLQMLCRPPVFQQKLPKGLEHALDYGSFHPLLNTFFERFSNNPYGMEILTAFEPAICPNHEVIDRMNLGEVDCYQAVLAHIFLVLSFLDDDDVGYRRSEWRFTLDFQDVFHDVKVFVWWILAEDQLAIHPNHRLGPKMLRNNHRPDRTTNAANSSCWHDSLCCDSIPKKRSLPTGIIENAENLIELGFLTLQDGIFAPPSLPEPNDLLSRYGKVELS